MASSSSSCYHVPEPKYDVFISFRGADIRSSFLSHLVRELRRQGIDFYYDEDSLHPGDEISSTLLQAIQEASISLVVFSEHYASSKWCMEELVKIIECMEQDQRIVIPVFYKVDPSDVRHQKESFGKALDKHQERFKENMEKVNGWRSALKKAANLSGFHYPSKYKNESDLIEVIVNDVLEKLSHIFPSETTGLVGIDKNLECIESLLAIESTEVRILGIWGMGGIGKTTVAEAVFNKYSFQYEGSCFLENVREESQKYGLPYLFQKLVSELLRGEKLFLKGPAKARSSDVRRKMSQKKVFVVLDDVSSSQQIDHLIGEQTSLGPGSRVIITTRDKKTLKNVHGVYEVQKLNSKYSLKLFCLNAFNKIYPEIGYENLSKMAVGYADGIPLALKVLGSFLTSSSIKSWESALRKLKSYPNMDIYNVLKLSYDGLDDSERNIFLDIAFFFKGEDKDNVIRFLDSCSFFADIGIENLISKALIKISYDNKIQMHDLIVQMGWEIVRQESNKDPGQRSRLSNPEDVYNVLKNNQGTDLVEGIMLDLSQTRDLYLQADTFKRMPKLRFLKFHFPYHRRSSNLYISPTLELFFDELRYLEWSGYPLTSQPSSFCAEKLVELRLPYSQVSKLWDGVQDLVNLEEIDLRGCKHLVELPNFSKSSNLKRINLIECESLCLVHPSILSLHMLEKLLLLGCKSLKSLKGEIHSKSLKHLNVNNCRNLEEFSVLSEEITELSLWGTRINMLHSSIGRLRKLKCLFLDRLALESLPNELCFLTSLWELQLCGCKQLIELPHNIKALSSLQVLYLRDCSSLRSLPELPPSIRNLDATNCSSLEIVVFSTKAAFSSDEVFISFINCTKLDEHSLYDIMEFTNLAMVRAAIRNLLEEGACYFEEAYPGSKVPEWFKYKTSQASSITFELKQPDQLFGFFLCFVISKDELPFDPGYRCIECQYQLGGGGNQWCHTTRVNETLISDHVYLEYDPSVCDEILRDIATNRANDRCTIFNPKISFEWTSEHDCLVKEWGVSPIYVSDIQDYIQKLELELEFDSESEKYQGIDGLDLNALMSVLSLKIKKKQQAFELIIREELKQS